MFGKLRILLVLFLIVVPMAGSTITINPLKYEIKDIEFNKTYNIIITVINPDSRAYDIQIMKNKDSYYLSDLIEIDPMLFNIEPNQKKNIQLSLILPETLSPEQHSLNLDFFSDNNKLGSFKLSFTVPGQKIEEILMEDVTLNKQPGDNLLSFDFRLKNTGTVIARGSPIIEIFQDDEIVESFGEESSIMIMPGEDYNLSLMYDTSRLAAGDYGYAAKFSYNDLETDTSKGIFSVSKEEKSQDAENIDIYEGEILKVSHTIYNPQEGLSFYSIQYNITGTEIGNTIEGEFQTKEKIIELEIDTSEYPAGTYELEILAKSGSRLENIEKRLINIKIRSKNIYYVQGMLLFLVGISSIVIVVFFVWPYVLKRSQNRFAHLNYEIVRLKKDYGDLEQSMKDFTQEINSFINDSNQWLKKEGYSHYGFR